MNKKYSRLKFEEVSWEWRSPFLPSSILHLPAFICSIFLLYSLIAGCTKNNNDCLKSTGEIITEERLLGTFTRIEAHNNVNVIITQGSTTAVSVEAGENLIGKVTTEVQNDILIIGNDNKCNWVRSYKHEIDVHVTVANLQEIDHYGFGNITSTNTIISDGLIITIYSNGDVNLDINMNYCYSDVHKSGDLILSGYASINSLWTIGNNWIRCQDLVTDSTYVVSKTTGDCLVNASFKLKVLLEGTGDVYYSGDPADVELEIVGDGAVIKN